jgi:hypothetical protein
MRHRTAAALPRIEAGIGRASTRSRSRGRINPRTDAWADHFVWEGPVLLGLTPVARATIDVLNINAPARVEHRRLLLASGQWSVSE